MNFNTLESLIYHTARRSPKGDIRRGKLLTPKLSECGINLKLGVNAYVHTPELKKFGSNVYIGVNTYIGAGEIVLSSEVIIGAGCSITGSNHSIQNGSFRFGSPIYKPVYIGFGTWIGSNACIVAGVEIGDCCIIAAGAVVTKKVPCRSVVAGVPAKVIKQL